MYSRLVLGFDVTCTHEGERKIFLGKKKSTSMALYLNDFNLKILQYRREIYIVMIKLHVSSNIRFRKKKINFKGQISIHNVKNNTL